MLPPIGNIHEVPRPQQTALRLGNESVPAEHQESGIPIATLLQTADDRAEELRKSTNDITAAANIHHHHHPFTCTICLSGAKDPVLTTCGHLFCWECLEPWLKKSHKCPMCKYTIRIGEDVIPIFINENNMNSEDKLKKLKRPGIPVRNYKRRGIQIITEFFPGHLLMPALETFFCFPLYAGLHLVGYSNLFSYRKLSDSQKMSLKLMLLATIFLNLMMWILMLST
ncbi:MAG: hypothetical protein MHMPM18_004406 [Marteilia pararefringens]